MGHLSPYLPNPSGFGVDEYPLPRGAKIAQLQVKVNRSSMAIQTAISWQVSLSVHSVPSGTAPIT